MKFVTELFTQTLEVKKSKFIAYLFPFKDFDFILDKLKKEHPKARHFVYAYRYLNQFEQIVENSSDDGEPKGTSGKPSLSVLQGNKIINTAVIIVRYFGGIKLGTGGLVKSYGDSVNLVIENSILDNYVKLDQKVLKFDYQFISQIEYILKKYDITVIDKKFSESVEFLLDISKEDLDNLKQDIPRGCILDD